MVYRFTSDKSARGVDPQEAGELIARLADQHDGAVPGPQIVDAARAKKSPIHSWFTWDDAEAAELQRTQEAGQLVRSLVVVEQTEDGFEHERPAYYHVNYVRQNGEPTKVVGYQAINMVTAEPTARMSAADYLLRQLEGVLRRADELGVPRMFSGVRAEAERIRQRLEDERRQRDDEAEAA